MSGGGEPGRDAVTLWSQNVTPESEVSDLVDAVWSAMPGSLKSAVDSGQVSRFSLLTNISTILQRKNGFQDLAPGLSLHYRT